MHLDFVEPEKLTMNRSTKILASCTIFYCVVNLKCTVAQAITNSCGRSRKRKAILDTNVNIV